ncbi:hypothetical protein DCAR_0729117 [Daucus carota subsp. sativus]|uniref:DUF569 domain-containing protein n=1 Tax=Daucus carota subsp. sativus TaxID=79200 RepID=A0AAF0XME0_DAUCS|nr:PREDICTED: uncharacterized protein LOC108194141 isoform X1 [Daucus carota subsp. sativus]XP_017216536.1 PREDICTED: uncharacterized protein LOC108194141 isoform X2 [Daucus carota subsp. sativus]WOH09659.1 hypothetical protein DCAR_0729117 [Daucus carota subsp. sativus]
MEFFNQAKAVRLQSHLDKFLTANPDEETVRQSRNGSSHKACWTVELVEGKSHIIRLKSCYGWYLTASDEPFLLGMTGKKVVQSDTREASEEWEPIREGNTHVKLRSKDGGMYLRANGGTPPWRNSVTHDFPYTSATQGWVLWAVEAIDVSEFSDSDHSFNSLDSSEPSVDAHSPYGAQLLVQNGAKFNALALSSQMSLLNASWIQPNGMEYFVKAKAVRLRNRHGKYLVADDDQSSIRQSRNGSSQKSTWTVEFVSDKRNKIRLKSCHGLYLTATAEPFLLGMTGKKVIQNLPATKLDASVEWEPIKEGTYVKLKTNDANFLRANWGTPPWRNSVTHDIPHRSATQDWILWEVEVLDFRAMPVEYDTLLTFSPSFSPAVHMLSPYPGPPVVLFKHEYSPVKMLSSGMEFFTKAKTVRLKSHHNKYLRADHDKENVFQNRRGSTKTALWIVEFVQDVDTVVRLRSIFGRYLTATDQEKILGLTGRKVLQTVPARLDSSVEWEPIREGSKVKLKTRYGNFLRANGGLPPWRNSITHDIPHVHNGWILWDVDVVERQPDTPKKVERSETPEVDEPSSSVHLQSPPSSADEADDADASPQVKSEGRMVYYTVADDKGKVPDDNERGCFHFTGVGLEELAHQLEEETGIESVILCSRNPLNGKLYPLRLALPPNNASVNVVLVSSTSTVASEFA